MAPLIHATAEVAENTKIGENTKIWHHSQVRPNAVIGENCNIGKGVYIDADVHIGDNVKIQNYVSVYHGVTLEDGVFMVSPGGYQRCQNEGCYSDVWFFGAVKYCLSCDRDKLRRASKIRKIRNAIT